MTDILIALVLAAVLATLALAALILSALRRRAAEDPQAALAPLLREELRLARQEAAADAARLREEISRTQTAAQQALTDGLAKLGATQQQRLDAVTAALNELSRSQREEAERLRGRVDARLQEIQSLNERKLEEMRRTVDEKLQTTLEQRLGESFRLVSSQLEAVQKGLGEMKSLADGVGDLKRVLTNVKTRGTWGETRLAEILEQILTPDQYATNVAVKPDGRERVEFAIRLPGRPGERDEPVWLPVDSKFPQEDYDRLVEASQAGDAEAVREAADALARRVRDAAREIQQKYIAPPHTTDFAILFLPTEGLYAEILRQPGLHEQLQREHRVLVTGPTTFAAVLNSLRMGFRTLAIEKRSSEVWRILSAVKTEFAKFGEAIEKVRKKVHEVDSAIGDVQRRNRVMAGKLRSVESLPEGEARAVLQLPEGDAAPDEPPPEA